MRSSSTRPELYRLIWHPAVSISVATTSMLALMSLLSRLVGTPGPRLVSVVFVVLAAVVEAALGNLLFAERAGVANRLRELAILLIVFYLVLSFLRPGPLGQRFAPSDEHLFPILAVGITWLNAFQIHNRLRGREGLLRTLAGKHGETLRHALIDRQHDMALTVREVRGARAGVVSWFALLCVIAIITATGVFTDSDLPPDSAAFILLCANALATAIAIATLNGFIDEYAANGNGITVPFRFQRRRLLAATGVIGGALLASFLLSRRESLLPLDAIVNVLRWFTSLFDRGETTPFPTPPPVSTNSAYYSELLRAILPDGEPELPPLWLRLLAILLRRLAVALATGTLTVLIFAPIFSPAFREGLRSIRPRKLARNLISRISRRMRILARWMRIRWKMIFTTRKRPGEAGEESVGSAGAGEIPGRFRPGVRKRRQMDRAASLFAQLVEWGRKHDLVYRQSEAAREFLGRVSAAYPERLSEARTCGSIFWRARYSRETLRVSEMREYARSVRRITGAG